MGPSPEVCLQASDFSEKPEASACSTDANSVLTDTEQKISESLRKSIKMNSTCGDPLHTNAD